MFCVILTLIGNGDLKKQIRKVITRGNESIFYPLIRSEGCVSILTLEHPYLFWVVGLGSLLVCHTGNLLDDDDDNSCHFVNHTEDYLHTCDHMCVHSIYIHVYMYTNRNITICIIYI